MPCDLTNLKKKTNSITSEIISRQDENGCWNVLKPGDKYYPAYQYYCPNYKSTLWTLIFLADIKCRTHLESFERPFKIISDHFYDEKNSIYTIGKSHFPIPCLNGNMLYLHSYFDFSNEQRVNSIIDFFTEYQRFDDGDFKTPSNYPYFSNRSWKMERAATKLAVPFAPGKYGNAFVTERANEVLEFYAAV